jgi:hypothetical protein
MLDMVRRLKADPSTRHVQVIGGNIATFEGASALVEAGVGPSVLAALGHARLRRHARQDVPHAGAADPVPAGRSRERDLHRHILSDEINNVKRNHGTKP